MRRKVACGNCSGSFGSVEVGAGCGFYGLARMLTEDKWASYNQKFLSGYYKDRAPNWCPIQNEKLYSVI